MAELAEEALAIVIEHADFRSAQVIAQVSLRLNWQYQQLPAAQFAALCLPLLIYPDLPKGLLCQLRSIDKRWNAAVNAARPDLHNDYLAAQPIYVPMQFWFNCDPGLALPAVALNYDRIDFDIEHIAAA